MPPIERTVYIAVGSNVEAERHIPAARSALVETYGPVKCSSFYRSAPLGFEGPDFVNCVVRFRTVSAPEELTRHLKALEQRAGRRAAGANASRELDLDLVLYGDEVIERADLILPRPDVLEYAFVLRPLAELAPDLVHPLTGRTLRWHWAHFSGVPVALEAVTLPAATEGEGNGRGERI